MSHYKKIVLGLLTCWAGPEKNTFLLIYNHNETDKYFKMKHVIKN